MFPINVFPLDASTSSHGWTRRRTVALDLTLDGAQLKVENPRGFRIKVTAGPHAIGIALVDRQSGAGLG